MKANKEALITRNYIQFCYTCQKAHECTTEKQCMACWVEKGMMPAEFLEAEETKRLLREYAL
ncbi:hypothetical protein SAMN02799630_03875 [Paenibacillus sp. UNCCL117]|uniref:hypothetical protein n=1 Tax=unclassified Paenibacillus TaxID=185978 RepID=UPI0008860CA3|nr:MULTISPECIES: hypothetical protein [unclassified Paenibacillus]SDD57083.1 hypothetical protein SAMN04488602_11061 [Paenibacillus sp. cl123]SFW51249.1 hypothetical protein SAMN02799630_03875 [Paenibacillus sp. UNCCL117]